MGGRLRDYTNAAVALCAGAKGAVTTVLHSSSAELGCERFSHVHVSCRGEMFLYLVRGIFRGGAHGLNCSDGGLTRFLEEKQARAAWRFSEKAERSAPTKTKSRRAPRTPPCATVLGVACEKMYAAISCQRRRGRVSRRLRLFAGRILTRNRVGRVRARFRAWRCKCRPTLISTSFRCAYRRWR